MIIKSFNPNRKKTSTFHITLIIGFVLFLGLLVFSGSNGLTGYVVQDMEGNNLDNINLYLDKQFEVVEVQKDVNSMINLDVQSDFNSNIFVEINDCGYWKAGKDRDNTILYSINGIKEGNFNVGDPSLNTMQQVEIYKSNYLCLIIINRDYQLGNYGNINININQLDKDKWDIV